MQERQRRLGARAASGARPLAAAALAFTSLCAAMTALAQPGGPQAAGAAGAAAATTAPGHPVTANWTTAQDHADMMRQLGITKLRPGPSGQENAPNAANYDEALANPFPNLPEVLITNDGRAVTTPEMWRNVRRPEIVELFEREVVGRIPENVPDVTWEVVERANGMVGTHAVVGKRLIGRVDNSAFPAINVEIQMTVVTPADAQGPVPVLMMFGGARSIPGGVEPQGGGFGGFGGARRGGGPGGRGAGPGGGPPPASDPPATEQLIASGWGYVQINPASIQADNGAGLTKGIIGLTNKGEPRKPDDWGSLRAWGWGASRGLDYLETDPTVDATKVGIEGVSRYGKAALVTMAFDERFAVVLIGSSGEGGAKLHRRNFGEAVENLTAANEYHWMAGNFLKYGTEESSFGSMNAGDIPVDSHMLLALCAPRATFVSYGIPERGDANWLDQQGSFMAAVAAGPVFRLLGVRDLGTPTDDYNVEKKPAVNVSLLDGHLAWRQHDGGHTDQPNFKYFIPWASALLGHTPPADRALMRRDRNSQLAHADLLAKAKSGRVDVYFQGDSITRRWGALDYPELLAHWRETFHGWNAGNFAWGGDTTQNILWRITDGEADGVNPRVVVVLAGTNNIGALPAQRRSAEQAPEIASGVEAIVRAMQAKAPAAEVVLMGVFPRNDGGTATLELVNAINARLKTFAAGAERVRYLDINAKLANDRGLLDERFSDDGLHLNRRGYEVWAEALTPVLTELLGPRAKEDLAPPPTGDPRASGRV